MKVEVINTIKRDKKYYTTGQVLEVGNEEGKKLIDAGAAKAVAENVKAANVEKEAGKK